MPATAREFWAYVDRMSDDEDLGAASFLERAPPALLFRHRRRSEGRLHALPPMRRSSSTRRAAARPPAPMTRSAPRRSPRRASRACACSIASTAKSRSGRWTRASAGSVVVEIYTRIYLRRAGLPGVKLRTRAELNRALEGPRQPAGAAPLRAQRPPDRRAGDCGGHAPARDDRAAGLRARRTDAPHRPDRRLDVRRPLTQTPFPAAGLAQSVEQRFCKPKVAGSNPASGTAQLWERDYAAICDRT